MTTHRRPTDHAYTKPRQGEAAVHRRPGPMTAALALAGIGLAGGLGLVHAMSSGTADRAWPVDPGSSSAGGLALLGLGVLCVVAGVVAGLRRRSRRPGARPVNAAPGSGSRATPPPARGAGRPSSRREHPPRRRRRGGRLPAHLPRREPPGGSGEAPHRRGAGRDRRHRHLHAHRRGAGLRRPGRLAQQRPLHRPALLAQPAGARPAAASPTPRGRRRVRRPPAGRATNGGRIRPTITVFAPDRPGGRARGSGTSSSSGTPATATGRRRARRPALRRLHRRAAQARLAPRGPGSPFDVLPLVVEPTGDGPPLLRRSPGRRAGGAAVAPRPTPWFADLGLRWHAVPAICNMCLEIGGVSLPGGAVQRLVHGHRDRRPQPRRHRPLRPAAAWSPTAGPGHRPRPHAVARPRAGRAQPGRAALLRRRPG